MIATNNLTMEEVAKKVSEAGFYGWRVVVITAIVWAESGGNAWAINMNTHDPESASYLSLDLGLCQWNTYWWRTNLTSTRDAFDPAAALSNMFVVTDGGTKHLEWWNAYKSGAYNGHMSAARLAARAVGVPV